MIDFTLKNIIEKKMSVEQFKNEYWNKKALFIKGAVAPDAIKEFLPKEEFERALKENDPMWKWTASWTLPDEVLYAQEQGKGLHPMMVGISGAMAHTSRKAGAYITSADQHKYHIPSSIFVNSITSTLNSYSSGNNYCNVFQNDEIAFFQDKKGFGLHNDPQEVYCLHLHGKKTWFADTKPFPRKISVSTLGDKGLVHTNFDDTGEILPWDKWRDKIDLQEYVMEPGDFLYMPAFTLHKTKGSGEYSLSLNVLRGVGNILHLTNHLMEKICYDKHFQYTTIGPMPESALEIKQHLVNKISDILEFVKELEVDYFKLVNEIIAAQEPESKRERYVKDNNQNTAEPDTYCRNLTFPFSLSWQEELGQKVLTLSTSLHSYTFDDPKFHPLIELFVSGVAFTSQDVMDRSKLKWSPEDRKLLNENLQVLLENRALLPHRRENKKAKSAA